MRTEEKQKRSKQKAGLCLHDLFPETSCSSLADRPEICWRCRFIQHDVQRPESRSKVSIAPIGLVYLYALQERSASQINLVAASSAYLKVPWTSLVAFQGRVIPGGTISESESVSPVSLLRSRLVASCDPTEVGRSEGTKIIQQASQPTDTRMQRSAGLTDNTNHRHLLHTGASN